MKMRSLFLLCFLVTVQLPAQVLLLPPRGETALTGSQVVALISPLSREAREEALFHEITTGNVPEFIRALCPVTIHGTAGGQMHTIAFFVIPDYLPVGADSDYFLSPMTPLLAQRLADALHCTMPTRLMVNAIFAAATVKLAPAPIAPSAEMITVPVFNDHNTMVRQQRMAQLAAHPLGELVGGDKKDVVISNKIYQPKPTGPQHPVVIYGWHQIDSSMIPWVYKPIQPLYNGHEETYADYSHGIRLVQDTLLLDGTASTVTDLLRDTVLSVLLSDEGVIPVPRYRVLTAPASAPIESEQPQGFLLEQNWPNPWNPSTVIGYTIGDLGTIPKGPLFGVGLWEGGRSVLVQLTVYDILGRQVAVLVNEHQAPGHYQVRFSVGSGSLPAGQAGASGGDGAKLASGAYFYRLTAGSFMQVRRMMLLK